MWIASKYGYFSIVKKDGGWHIRARKAADLELLKKAVGGNFGKRVVHLTPDADYCSRIFVQDDPSGKSQMDALFSTLESSIDYPNFKSEVAKISSQKGKLPYYGKVWGEMMDYQSQEERS